MRTDRRLTDAPGQNQSERRWPQSRRRILLQAEHYRTNCKARPNPFYRLFEYLTEALEIFTSVRSIPLASTRFQMYSYGAEGVPTPYHVPESPKGVAHQLLLRWSWAPSRDFFAAVAFLGGTPPPALPQDALLQIAVTSTHDLYLGPAYEVSCP